MRTDYDQAMEYAQNHLICISDIIRSIEVFSSPFTSTYPICTVY